MDNVTNAFSVTERMGMLLIYSRRRIRLKTNCNESSPTGIIIVSPTAIAKDKFKADASLECIPLLLVLHHMTKEVGSCGWME